jgi:hypothetical protein
VVEAHIQIVQGNLKSSKHSGRTIWAFRPSWLLGSREVSPAEGRC